MVDPINATGWSQMYDGNLINASYYMFDQAFGGQGWIIVMLFFAYQIIAYMKTENVLMVWSTSAIMVGASIGIGLLPSFYSWSLTNGIVFATLAIELGIILYGAFKG